MLLVLGSQARARRLRTGTALVSRTSPAGVHVERVYAPDRARCVAALLALLKETPVPADDQPIGNGRQERIHPDGTIPRPHSAQLP